MDEDTCDLCGECHDGNDSIWCCSHPQFVEKRQQVDAELASIDPRDLPTPIKNGIAPAMSHEANRTYWGTSMEHRHTEGYTRNALIGYKAPPFEAPEAKAMQKIAVGSNVSAMQLIATLRGAHGQGSSPSYPENVHGEMSKKVMGYTDGGVKNPESSAWQIAGFGIWWLDRVPDEENVRMTKYTHQHHVDEGSSMWANMAGQHAHSTWTEIAAVLIAMLRPVPLHLGSDSQAMIDKANFLMDEAALWQLRMATNHWNARNPCKKPWSLQRDGDLWEKIWEASLLRGPRMLKLTKVKGHATIKNIVEGTSTVAHKKGNDNADTAATAGIDEGRPGLLQLANWMADQHKAYCKFMLRIQTFIFKLSKFEKELREEVDKEKRGNLPIVRPTISICSSFPNPNGVSVQDVDLLPPPNGKHRYSSHQTLLDDIHAFLRNSTFAIPTDENAANEAMTWLELFYLFDSSGFNRTHFAEADSVEIRTSNRDERMRMRQAKWVEHRMKHRAHAKSGPKKPLASAVPNAHLSTELDTFRRITKYAIRHSGSISAKGCFAPFDSGYRSRMFLFGISGHHPTIRGSLVLTPERRMQVTAALSLHRTGQNSKQTQLFSRYQKKCNDGMESEYRCHVTTLTTRGPPRWRHGSVGSIWPPAQLICMKDPKNQVDGCNKRVNGVCALNIEQANSLTKTCTESKSDDTVMAGSQPVPGSDM